MLNYKNIFFLYSSAFMLSKCYTMCYTHLSLHCKIAMLPINYPETQSSRTDYKREYIAFFLFFIMLFSC